jgi:hypothetical protein
MEIRIRWTPRVIAALCAIVLSLTVIAAPQVFYFQSVSADIAAELDDIQYQVGVITLGSVNHYLQMLSSIHSSIRAFLTNQVQEFNEVNGPIDVALRNLAEKDADLENVKSNLPWFGQYTPEQEMALMRVQRRHDVANDEVAVLTEARENALTRARSLTPVWSKQTFDETRAVWWKGFTEYKESATRVSQYDLFFQALSNRDDSIAAFVVRAAINYGFRLISFGAIQFFDFCVRLPFYLQEYGHEADSSKVATYLFYTLAILGAVGALRRWCECSCDVHLCSLLCCSLCGASALVALICAVLCTLRTQISRSIN